MKAIMFQSFTYNLQFYYKYSKLLLYFEIIKRNQLIKVTLVNYTMLAENDIFGEMILGTEVLRGEIYFGRSLFMN